jgi:branched-chain amino acid transport system substrate-binding protein
VYAPYGYDAVNTTAAAMVKAASPDPRRYLSELAKIDHEGVTGPSAFDKNGDVLDGTLTLYTYRNGEKSKLAVVQ